MLPRRVDTVRNLDRSLVFDAGEIVEEGRHDDLVLRPGGTYRRLVETQAEGALV